ncbi:MAG: hypothetical protein Q4C49_07445 [Bacillota bacterium]|nr:hypothetical protein [Bacillota bacterium]
MKYYSTKEAADLLGVTQRYITKLCVGKTIDGAVKNGFNQNYDKGEKYYRADNKDGYHVSIEYIGFNTMTIRLDEPDEELKKEEKVVEKEQKEEVKKESTLNGIRPEFKEAMDKYEKFMDEYCDFMKKFSDNQSDVSLLLEYAEYLGKYTDAVEAFDEWDDEDLNDAETAYYIEVQTRINKKLLEVSSDL